MAAATVAVVVPDLAVGGLQNMAVGLAQALDPGRFAPRFYTFDAEGPFGAVLDEAGIPRRHLPRPAGVAPGYARQLADQLVADGARLVHCHNVTAMFHGSRAARRAGRLPVLFTEHDREMPAPFKHRLLHRLLARHVHHTATVSAGLAADLVRLEGFDPRRTAPLLNGIPDPAEGCAGDRDQARQALGWDQRPVVLAVGSLTAVKNHVGLLRAWARLLEGRDDAPRLVIAGEGPERPALEAALASLPAGAVTLLGNRDDVPRLLAACDVFVLPSHREGLPLCLVEAHAMSRSSVAFDTGGNGEVLVHGETGRLVPLGDEAGLAATLGALLDDPAARARFGAAARQRFESTFTHARMVADYQDLYDRLLAGGQG